MASSDLPSELSWLALAKVSRSAALAFSASPPAAAWAAAYVTSFRSGSCMGSPRPTRVST
jgi:hypothetical protein